MQIKHIKQNLTITSLATNYGHTPNRNNLIKCPFHEDDKPSLQLYPKTNTWHCFGCGKGTDQIDFIKYSENCTTHKAILKAKEVLLSACTERSRSGAKALLNHQPIKTKPMKEVTEQPEITQQERIKAMTTAFTYLARSINGRDKKPKEYLKQRSLDPEKITVGYDAHMFHKSKEATAVLKELYLGTVTK